MRERGRDFRCHFIMTSVQCRLFGSVVSSFQCRLFVCVCGGVGGGRDRFRVRVRVRVVRLGSELGLGH